MNPKLVKRLRLFSTHGVDLSSEVGDQVVGYCPFSRKDNKFYINTENLLWDSKTAGLSGNVQQFLEYRAASYQEAMTPERWTSLASDRGLPVEALKSWPFGWTGAGYSLPVTDATGTVVDIRIYSLADHIMKSTPGASVGLLGSPSIQKQPHAPIYLCEGEWDAVAIDYNRSLAGANGVVLAVPGAGTFKDAWVKWFVGRHVYTIFDADAAGQRGELKVLEQLRSTAQSIHFVHWPPDTPNGFDARDWVRAGLAVKKPKAAWKGLQALFRTTPKAPDPRSIPVNGTHLTGAAGPEGGLTVKEVYTTAWENKTATLADVYRVFKKWLFLDSTDAIDIMLATYVSQSIDGEPIWMFLVGPPGSAKTETLNSLSLVPSVYMTSTLTPHSLISGASWKDGGDPSLIPRLDGQVMVIKDFTSILSLRDTEKDEIFGILRDAFDGKCGKEFGNGVVRKYESRFTIMAAVTPSIYSLSSSHTALGERFLKFGVGDNLRHKHEDDIIRRAISNIDRETTMRAEMADVVQAFLAGLTAPSGPTTASPSSTATSTPTISLPSMSEAMRTRVISLARFGARMRGSVTRDTYRNDIVTSRPSAEVGSRLGKQLAKLCQALATVHGTSSVDERDYRLVKKTVLDTIPQRTEDVLRAMLLGCAATPDHVLSMQDISTATRYPTATISRILQDLNVLDIANRTQVKKGKFLWCVSPYISDLIVRAGLYRTKEETDRPKPFSMRVKTHRARRASV